MKDLNKTAVIRERFKSVESNRLHSLISARRSRGLLASFQQIAQPSSQGLAIPTNLDPLKMSITALRWHLNHFKLNLRLHSH